MTSQQHKWKLVPNKVCSTVKNTKQKKCLQLSVAGSRSDGNVAPSKTVVQNGKFFFFRVFYCDWQYRTFPDDSLKYKCVSLAIIQFCYCEKAKNNLLAPELFSLILAHPVYKMWIIREPNKLELWNKMHFEGEKNGEYTPCLKYSVPIFVE